MEELTCDYKFKISVLHTARLSLGCVFVVSMGGALVEFADVEIENEKSNCLGEN